MKRAEVIGAKKIYLCASSAENAIAFYQKLGCVSAVEPDQKLIDEDLNDIQLEFDLRGMENAFEN